MVLLILILWTFLHIRLISSSLCEGDQTSCTDPAAEAEKYSSNRNRWNTYTTAYEQAYANYTPCAKTDCSCYSKTLDSDLSAWSNGTQITKDMTRQALTKSGGVLYQVINHKLYRSKDCLFPSRCDGVEYFLLKILPHLSNLEFVMNFHDNPLMYNFGEPIPLFSFSKIRRQNIDIMFPAWSFWDGGPAVWPIYPTGLGRWDDHRQSITKAADKIPWNDRLSKGFFRGSRTNTDRDPLVLLSRVNLDLFDAQYTKNQAWKSDQDTLYRPPAEEIKLEDHCRYKYLFNFAGVAASFRLRHLFLCKSTVIHVGKDWLEFFYEAMTPWVHYVPLDVAAVSSAGDLLQFLKENDNIARQIADDGFKFIWEHLRQEDVICYWRRLLRRYSRLLGYKVELEKDMIAL